MTCKNPHVIPRYPSWRLWLMCSGYQSLDTSVKPLAVTHDTSRRNPSLNNGGNPPNAENWGSLRIEENPALAAQFGSLVGWPMMGMINCSEWDIGEPFFFHIFLDLSKKKSEEFRKKQSHFSILPCHKKYMFPLFCLNCINQPLVFPGSLHSVPHLNGLNGARA